eukprot:scaffold20356_cov125-Isochrysis_galbana.AAC.18
MRSRSDAAGCEFVGAHPCSMPSACASSCFGGSTASRLFTNFLYHSTFSFTVSFCRRAAHHRRHVVAAKRAASASASKRRRVRARRRAIGRVRSPPRTKPPSPRHSSPHGPPSLVAFLAILCIGRARRARCTVTTYKPRPIARNAKLHHAARTTPHTCTRETRRDERR